MLAMAHALTPQDKTDYKNASNQPPLRCVRKKYSQNMKTKEVNDNKKSKGKSAGTRRWPPHSFWGKKSKGSPREEGQNDDQAVLTHVDSTEGSTKRPAGSVGNNTEATQAKVSTQGGGSPNRKEGEEHTANYY